MLPGGPVETPQAVQDSTADLVLGVSLQFDVVVRIKTIDGGNQSDDTGRDQIFQVDAFGKPFMDSARNQSHLGQMIKDQLFPLISCQRR